MHEIVITYHSKSADLFDPRPAGYGFTLQINEEDNVRHTDDKRYPTTHAAYTACVDLACIFDNIRERIDITEIGHPTPEDDLLLVHDPKRLSDDFVRD